MMLRVLVSLVFMIAFAATAVAEQDRREQIFEFIYLGQAERFKSNQDVLDADVCAAGTWTVGKSGLGALASDWKVQTIHSSEWWNAFHVIASRMWSCKIFVLPRNTLQERQDLLKRAIEYDYVDMTDAIATLASRQAPPAPVELDGERRAQIFQWIYIGKPERFKSRQDILDTSICHTSDWTPEASALGQTASDWKMVPDIADRGLDVVHLVHAGAFGCVIVFPRVRFENSPKLVEAAVQFGFADMTEAIAGLASNVAYDAAYPRGKELADGAEKLYQRTLEQCDRPYLSSTRYMDCTCMAERRRAYTLANPESLLKPAHALRNPQLLLERGSLIPQDCINEAGIREVLTKNNRQFWTMNSLSSNGTVTFETYNACQIEEFIRLFRENPTTNTRAREKITIEANLTCKRRLR